MQVSNDSSVLELYGLNPDPGQEWLCLLKFVGLNDGDKNAMSRSVESLIQRAQELVVNTYNYLLSVPETAAVLGWEQGADEEHLAERRRFFSIWLSRSLGLDTSEEFAYYLFRAGKFHAGHGPRQIHTPLIFVTGSIGLVLASFATFMQEAHLSADVIAGAMAGWSKYLTAQLYLMQKGYDIAREFDTGNFTVEISVFGRMRDQTGCKSLHARLREGANAGDLLRKFFDYVPQARADALERIWRSHEKPDSLWVETYPVYAPRYGWRVLLNGRDLRYNGGFTTPVHAGDTLAIFPPGR